MRTRRGAGAGLRMPRFSPAVVDHFSNPRNCGRLPAPDVAAFVGNPVCGDQILLTARTHDGTLDELGFEAFGCSASLAVASILTEQLRGMPIAALSDLDADAVLRWTGELGPDQYHVAELGVDVIRRLADNLRTGISDEGSRCGT